MTARNMSYSIQNICAACQATGGSACKNCLLVVVSREYLPRSLPNTATDFSEVLWSRLSSETLASPQVGLQIGSSKALMAASVASAEPQAIVHRTRAADSEFREEKVPLG